MSALAVSQLLESSQEKGVELVLETSSFENQVIDSSVEVGNVKEILHWNQHIFKPSSTVHDTFFSHCRITFYYIEHLFVSSFLYDSNTILFRSRFDRTAFWFISNSAIYDYKYHTFLLHSTYGPIFIITLNLFRRYCKPWNAWVWKAFLRDLGKPWPLCVLY